MYTFWQKVKVTSWEFIGRQWIVDDINYFQPFRVIKTEDTDFNEILVHEDNLELI